MLRAVPSLLGAVASDRTVSRLVDRPYAAGPKASTASRAARAEVCEHVWQPAGASAPDAGRQMIVDLDVCSSWRIPRSRTPRRPG